MLLLFLSVILSLSVTSARADTGSLSGSVVCVKVANDQIVCGPKVNVTANVAKQAPLIGAFAADKQQSAVSVVSEGVGHYDIRQVVDPITQYRFDSEYPKLSELNRAAVHSRKSGNVEQSIAGVLTLPEGVANSPSQTNQLDPYYYGRSDSSSNSYYLPVLPVTEYRYDSPLARTHLPVQIPSSVTVNLPPTAHLSKTEVGARAPSLLSSGGPLSRPVQPAVQYSTHYVLENPAVPSQQTAIPQAQLVPTISRIPVSVECKLKPVFSPPTYGGFRSSSSESIFPGIATMGEDFEGEKTDRIAQQGKASDANLGYVPYQLIDAPIDDKPLQNASEMEVQGKRLSDEQRSSLKQDVIDAVLSELNIELERMKKNEQRLAELRNQVANARSVPADTKTKPSPTSSETETSGSATESRSVSR